MAKISIPWWVKLAVSFIPQPWKALVDAAIKVLEGIPKAQAEARAAVPVAERLPHRL